MEKKKTSTIAFWIPIIIIIQIAILPIFIPQQWFEEQINKEKILISQSLGTNNLFWIENKSSYWFKQVFIDTNIVPGAKKVFVQDKNSNEKTQLKGGAVELISNTMERGIDRIALLIEQIMIRLLILKIWIPYLIVIATAAAMSGYYLRQIKKSNFAFTSPIIHSFSSWGILVLIYVSLALSTVPMAISPNILPILFTVICLLVGQVVSNVQKTI